MRIGIVLVLSGFLGLLAVAHEASHPTHSRRGFSVHLDPLLGDESRVDLAERALELLDAHLLHVTRVVPADALAKLREIPIWLSFEDPVTPCACYHPSAKWLEEHGHDPAKARAVEIAHAERFLTWSIDQPAMVLHELAHGFHHRVLGYEDERVLAAFEAARDEGLYDSVLRGNGRRERAYALQNEKEYFAELTEAWFGTNDFYPFVRAEVREHDPRGAELLAEVWGE